VVATSQVDGITSVCISYYLRAIAVESLISVCFSISPGRRSISQRYRRPGGGLTRTTT
jgi:hypothetical protein